MNLVKKIPWGIIAGVCGVIIFYTIIATVIALIGMNAITAIVEEAAGLFGTWWQTLLFVCNIVFGVGFVGSLIMFILIKAGVFGAKEELANA